MNRAAEWEILLSPAAVKLLSRIPSTDRDRIIDALRVLAAGPFHADIARLHGRPEWRLRVGSWRVLLRIDLGARVVLATHIGSRGDIYKD